MRGLPRLGSPKMPTIPFLPFKNPLHPVHPRRQVCEFVVDLLKGIVDLLEGLVDPGYEIPQDQKNDDEPDIVQDQDLMCGPEIDHGLDF